MHLARIEVAMLACSRRLHQVWSAHMLVSTQSFLGEREDLRPQLTGAGSALLNSSVVELGVIDSMSEMGMAMARAVASRAT